MIIKLNRMYSILFNLRLAIKENVKAKYLYLDKDLAKHFGVSPTVLSRQINTNRIDATFLHKYLVKSGVLPLDCPMPNYESLESFISAYPNEFQTILKKVLSN